MSSIEGTVRFIRTDCPEDDYFALEAKPAHYVGTVHGPRYWLEDLIGQRVRVTQEENKYCVEVIKEREISNGKG